MSKGDIRATLGAIALGGLVCLFLSGIVAMQVYLYLRVYKKDRLYIKGVVFLVWSMDFVHTVMVCIANWMYLIEGFGDVNTTDHISWSIGVTVALTALVTFLVHCFFTHRIHIVSKGNYLLTYPLATLALFRLIAALVSTSEMIRLKSYSAFVKDYGYVFTMGLGSAVALDVFITMGLCHYLRQSKSGFSSMNDIIDSLVLYTVETGLATCVTTIVSLICWVTMPHNLIFLGLHFTISKLYANSLMATLNSRAQLRARSQSSSNSDGREFSLPVMLSGARAGRSGARSARIDPTGTRTVEISVQKTVHREIEGELAADVNLKTARYGERSGQHDTDDHSSSDLQSERGKGFLGSM